jgi:hypothetical protein
MVHDLRALLRLAAGRTPDLSAAILESRTLRSTPESGHRAAGYDGAEAQEGLEGARGGGHYGTSAHLAPNAGQRARRQGASREAGGSCAGGDRRVGGVGVCGSGILSGQRADTEAQAHGIRLEVVKHPEARRGFVLLPREDGLWSAILHGHRVLGGW